ncbi:MAG: hypothetical protein EBZ77_08325, partial [Chitinophagia bacterium]|nr:hypothetical protein [Chitinophagia bacterium]
MRYLVSVITVVMCLWSAQASAKHIIGGDLLYTHITGNTYKITLTLYGDCYNKGSFNLLPGSSPLISISRNGTLVDKVILPNVSGDGTDVSPVCPSERNNTTCNNGTLPGIFKFVYEANVSLTAGPGNWSFVFRGTLVNSQAGRSDNITNIYSPGTSFMQLTATLDNTLGDNSSPQYSTLATGYSCINVLQQYNQGASDPDGDSLGFALVPAIDSATSSSVNYVPPYTATNPIATAPGDFAFNTLNGQLNFTPNAVQKSLVVYQVSEYRGGRLVGTSEREMTFIVRDDCTDAPPAPYVNNLTGGSLQKGNVIELCQGGGPVSFAVNFNNAARDTIILTPGDVPTGATLNITGNNTTSPQANCFLNTSTLPAGSYSFHLSIKNIHCPISSQQSVAYTVHIVPTPSVVVTQLTPTRCVGKAALRYDLIN